MVPTEPGAPDRLRAARRPPAGEPTTSPAAGVDARGLAGSRPKLAPTVLAPDQRGRQAGRPRVVVGLVVAHGGLVGSPRSALLVRGPLLAHPYPFIG